MMDPLGLQSPYTALQDKLFKQFTVLSNYPTYHGVLALIYSLLAERGITPKHKDFSLQFRRAEILWGMLHTMKTASSSVLNIKKYTALMLHRDSLSLNDIKKTDRIYSRLGYGTLGHYSSPSVTWGILGKSGQHLTASGRDLAAAFSERKGKSLSKALVSWLNGDSWSVARFEEFAMLFEIGAAPDRAEAGVWRKLIDDYCEQTPQVRCLWDKPLTEQEERMWWSDSTRQAACFEQWRSRYAPLKIELTQIELFQQLAALVQHIFEREYLACAEKGNRSLPFAELEADLAADLCETARAYTQTPHFIDSKGLFLSLAGKYDYQEVAQKIIDHHVSHQKSKGSVPFIEDGEIRVRDRFAVGSYGERCKALESAASPKARVALIAFQHPRDWHFKRAADYHRYAQFA